MRCQRPISVLLSAIAGIALFSCVANAPISPANLRPTQQNTASSNLRSVYSESLAAGGSVFRLDPTASAIRIYVFRGGAAARLGHNHVLSAPRFEGYVYVPRSGAAEARFDLEFRLDELEFDKPEIRSHMSAAYSGELLPQDIERARQHMLGEDNLQAQRFPFVRVHSLQIVGESPKFVAQVRVELHGQQREIWVPLNVEGLPEQVSARGSFVIRQTDFGIQPYSLLGGFVAVRDEVLVEFQLAGA